MSYTAEEFNHLDEDDIWEDFIWNDKILVKENIIDQSRWSTFFERIVKHNDKFFAIIFSRGSTECQEGSESIDDIYEVVPVEKTVTVYEKVK